MSPYFLHESLTLNIYGLGQGEDIYTYIFRDVNFYRFSVHSQFFDIIRTVLGQLKAGQNPHGCRPVFPLPSVTLGPPVHA